MNSIQTLEPTLYDADLLILQPVVDPIPTDALISEPRVVKDDSDDDKKENKTSKHDCKEIKGLLKKISSIVLDNDLEGRKFELSKGLNFKRIKI